MEAGIIYKTKALGMAAASINAQNEIDFSLIGGIEVRMHAIGKIPSSLFQSEEHSIDFATLTSRPHLLPVTPLFHKGFHKNAHGGFGVRFRL